MPATPGTGCLMYLWTSYRRCVNTGCSPVAHQQCSLPDARSTADDKHSHSRAELLGFHYIY